MTLKTDENANPNTSIRFIDLDAVVALTSLGKTTIYKLISCDEFPRQRVIAHRSVRWVESEVLYWMQSKLSN